MNKTTIHLLPNSYGASSFSMQRSDGKDGENSTLRVLGTEVTNGTQYKCGLLDLQSNSIVNYSAPVSLDVQGE